MPGNDSPPSVKKQPANVAAPFMSFATCAIILVVGVIRFRGPVSARLASSGNRIMSMGLRLRSQSYEYRAAASAIALTIFLLAPPLYLKSWLVAGYEFGTGGLSIALMWAASAAFFAALDRFSLPDD
jgi:hypothetical protein